MQAVRAPDPVEFEGRFYKIPAAESARSRSGRTARRWWSAAPPAAVERAARLGAELTLVIFDWESVGAIIATFREAEAAAGYEPGSLPVLLQVNGTLSDQPLDERGPLLGSLDQVAGDLERAKALRVGHVYWNSLTEDPLDQVPLIAQLRG